MHVFHGPDSESDLVSRGGWPHETKADLAGRLARRPVKNGGSTVGRSIGKEEALLANRKQVYGAPSVWLLEDVWQPSGLPRST